MVLLFSNSAYEAVWKEPGDRCQAAVVNVVSGIKRKSGDVYIETVLAAGIGLWGENRGRDSVMELSLRFLEI